MTHDFSSFPPLRSLAGVAAGGACYGVSMHAPVLGAGWGLLAVVAWTPLLRVWATASVRRVAVLTFVAQVAAGASGFFWVLFHPSPATSLASAGGLLAWALVFSVPWLLSTAVRQAVGVAGGLVALLTLQIAVEGGLSRGPWAFPWGLWGHALAGISGIRDLATWGGPGLLSLWIGVANVAAFDAWTGRVTGALAERARSSPSITSRAVALVGAAVLAVVSVAASGGPLGGPAAGDSPTSPPAERPTTVLLIQPATPATDWSDVRDGSRVDRLRAQTEAALDTITARPSVVVWPETALPLPTHRPARPLLQQWVDSLGIPLVTGGVATPTDAAAAPASSAYTNRAYFFRPGSGSEAGRGARRAGDPSIYDKHHLVPFAEHVPLADDLPVLRRLRVPAGGVPGYRRGPGVVVWDTALGPAAPLICFESVVAPYAARAARSGAEVLVTLAQTGWWGPGSGPAQHLAFTRLTAIATGRPVVVSTVSGPSTVVGPDGRVDSPPAGQPFSERAFGEHAAVLATVPPPRPLPPFVRWGDWLWYGSLALAGALLLATAAEMFQDRTPLAFPRDIS